jgi:Flp pilus assembly pilin Flp
LNNLLVTMNVMVQSLKDSEEGQNMAEYALVAALVSLAAAAILPGVGSSIASLFSSLSSNLALA